MKKIRVALFAVIVSAIFAGCSMPARDGEKIRDLDFTVVSEERQPEELKSMIEEKKLQQFKMTYTDGDGLYICIGYGEQETGGYSISVKELYLTENAVYVDTGLMGPGPKEERTEGVSYPYIVLKIENVDKTVVFQ